MPEPQVWGSSVLQGNVVVVTGGAGLLGRALCRAVVENGGIAVVADRDAAAIDAMLREWPTELRDAARGEVVDITSPSSVAELVDRVRRRDGRIDAVVNNAYPRNANYGRKLEDVSYDDFCGNVSSHLGGYFLVAQQFALFFRAQSHGCILNMASVYGVIAPRFGVYQNTPMTMPVEYAAIKSAVIHLTRYFAQYFKADGIRVNSISPGGIFNHQPDAFVGRYNSECGRIGMLAPTDVTQAAVFLLSGAARAVTGQNLVVDDGFSL